jgi:patatin-related protein
MAFETPSAVTGSTQELRLATTMTGGVSLAVWMAGVAREINLLAQASQWRRLGGTFPTECRLSKESAASLRLYAELIDLLDMVVDVDILSGTSAGGINAALLAWSRLTGSDLGGLRDLWLNLGALTELLRNPTDKSTPSLLYGDERMFAELANQIPTLDIKPFPPAAFPQKARTPSTTVYITTTLLTGETSRFTDSFGTLIQDVDRRGLFTFTEAELANPATVPALALAARSSASFPVAFEPSFVPLSEGTAKSGSVPARPAMARFANITRPHWVADGGLLDNQPIDVLLKRVFDRPARRAVRRVLLFVVPSTGPTPNLLKQPPPDDVNAPFGLVDGLLKDLAAATTQSIAADLRAIRTHQDRMEARTDAKLRLAELAARLPGTRLLTPSLLNDYRTRETTKQAQALTSALLRLLGSWPPASGNSTESIPKDWESALAVGGNAEEVCRGQITKLIEVRWSQPRDEELPESPADLARYGQPALEYAKGCAITLVQVAYQLARSRGDIAALAELTEGIHKACRRRTPIDLAELVHTVCINDEVRNGSLENAAQELAERFLDKSTAPADAWESLGALFVKNYGRLQQLTAVAPAASSSPKESLLDKDSVSATQLKMYLAYLGQENTPRIVARKLFDLAATQRAMLPAEADIDQPLELVQVSADTRSLFAPRFYTAEQKLTGMQFHHFGAFYKRSWRANDWMWGRLDGAGWLVHVLLDPRRVSWVIQDCEKDRERGESGARWFFRQLKALGAPAFPKPGFPLPPAEDGSKQFLTEEMVLDELQFLDDSSMEMPPSIPLTSLWLARVWQQRVLDEELDGLADTVLNPQSGKKPDWSPTCSRNWAERVLAASPGDAKYQLLDGDPVATETFASDKGSPLMARTLTKAAATASAAASSVRQLPLTVKPAVIALRTLTLAAYRMVSLTNGKAKWSIIAGAVLVVLGAVAAMQDAATIATCGLIVAAIGAYLIVLGTWQVSTELLLALLSATLLGAVLSLATPVVRGWLFGTEKNPGVVGTQVYWLGAQWWHPLLVVVIIVVAVAAIGAAKPGRK